MPSFRRDSGRRVTPTGRDCGEIMRKVKMSTVLDNGDFGKGPKPEQINVARFHRNFQEVKGRPVTPRRPSRIC